MKKTFAIIVTLIMLVMQVSALAGGILTDTPKTLTIWIELNDKATDIATSYNELPIFKELEKRTGVHIEFWHPPVGQTTEQFSTMIASGDSTASPTS